MIFVNLHNDISWHVLMRRTPRKHVAIRAKPEKTQSTMIFAWFRLIWHSNIFSRLKDMNVSKSKKFMICHHYYMKSDSKYSNHSKKLISGNNQDFSAPFFLKRSQTSKTCFKMICRFDDFLSKFSKNQATPPHGSPHAKYWIDHNFLFRKDWNTQLQHKIVSY